MSSSFSRITIFFLIMLVLIGSSIGSECVLNIPLADSYRDQVVASAMMERTLAEYVIEVVDLNPEKYDINTILSRLGSKERSNIQRELETYQAEDLKKKRVQFMTYILSQVSVVDLLDTFPVEQRREIIHNYVSRQHVRYTSSLERSNFIDLMLQLNPKLKADFDSKIESGKYSLNIVNDRIKEIKILYPDSQTDLSRDDIVFFDSLRDYDSDEIYSLVTTNSKVQLGIFTKRQQEYFIKQLIVNGDSVKEFYKLIDEKYEKDIIMNVLSQIFPERTRQENADYFQEMKPYFDVVSKRVSDRMRTLGAMADEYRVEVSDAEYNLFKSRFGNNEWQGLNIEEYGLLISEVFKFMKNHKSYLSRIIEFESEVGFELIDDRVMCRGNSECIARSQDKDLPQAVYRDYDDPTAFVTDLLSLSIVLDLEGKQGKDFLRLEAAKNGIDILDDKAVTSYLHNEIRREMDYLLEEDFINGFDQKGVVSGMTYGNLFAMAGANEYGHVKGDLLQSLNVRQKRMLRQVFIAHRMKVRDIVNLGLTIDEDVSYVYLRNKDTVTKAFKIFDSTKTSKEEISEEEKYIWRNIRHLDFHNKFSDSKMTRSMVKIIKEYRFNQDLDPELRRIFATKYLKDLGLTDGEVNTLFMTMQSGTISMSVSTLISDSDGETKESSILDVIESEFRTGKHNLEAMINTAEKIDDMDAKDLLLHHKIRSRISDEENANKPETIDVLIDYYKGDLTLEETVSKLERQGYERDMAVLLASRSFDMRRHLIEEGIAGDEISGDVMIKREVLDWFTQKLSESDLDKHISRGMWLIDQLELEKAGYSAQEVKVLKARYFVHDLGKLGPPDVSPDIEDMIMDTFEMKDPGSEETIGEVFIRNIAYKKAEDIIEVLNELKVDPGKNINTYWEYHGNVDKKVENSGWGRRRLEGLVANGLIHDSLKKSYTHHEPPAKGPNQGFITFIDAYEAGTGRINARGNWVRADHATAMKFVRDSLDRHKAKKWQDGSKKQVKAENRYVELFDYMDSRMVEVGS